MLWCPSPEKGNHIERSLNIPEAAYQRIERGVTAALWKLATLDGCVAYLGPTPRIRTNL
jgi:hypothetical protein